VGCDRGFQLITHSVRVAFTEGAFSLALLLLKANLKILYLVMSHEMPAQRQGAQRVEELSGSSSEKAGMWLWDNGGAKM
jgi:hypothetical protein